MLKRGPKMKPKALLLKCLAEQTEGQWSILCLDFDLAAQGDTLEQAKASLDAMLRDYLYDALAGDHKEAATYLLKRRAPLRYWAKFYLLVLRDLLCQTKSNGDQVEFTRTLPLVPAGA